MAFKTTRLCWQCHDIMAASYKLTEEAEPDLKRVKCDTCNKRGYFSKFSYDPTRPIKDIEGEQ